MFYYPRFLELYLIIVFTHTKKHNRKKINFYATEIDREIKSQSLDLLLSLLSLAFTELSRILRILLNIPSIQKKSVKKILNFEINISVVFCRAKEKVFVFTIVRLSVR